MGRNNSTAAVQPRSGRVVDRTWVVIGLVLGLAVTLIVLGAVMAPGRAHDIWVEVAKSGFQLAVVALAGGVVGAVLKDRDADREEERRVRQYRLDFRDQVTVSYGQIKAARRTLRTFGFDAPQGSSLSAEQVIGFRTEMASLNDAQLSLELDARKVEVLSAEFGPASIALARELSDICRYLRQVLFEWEADPTVIVAGGDASSLDRWPEFGRFVGYDEESVRAFSDGVADRITRIELLVLGAGGS